MVFLSSNTPKITIFPIYRTLKKSGYTEAFIFRFLSFKIHLEMAKGQTFRLFVGKTLKTFPYDFGTVYHIDKSISVYFINMRF